MYVIGTAGHVDHGKSTLVEALTGIDPDRWAEEKAREMTIDLGFAWLQLPGIDEEVGVIDVPGHRDFIENMLAGVGGMDLAMLIIAADEGVMPQTREHLAILDLLQVPRGIIVLTKTDLIDDPDWLELVELDVAEVVAGTQLADAPIVAVSAKSGTGLDELRTQLVSQLQATPPRQDMGQPRLPIDRVFSVSGFGTVVTGTLLGGSLRLGESVVVQPAGFPARVRGLQSHQTKIELARPGRRIAVNISGVGKDDIRRGNLLTIPAAARGTILCDVDYTHLEDATIPLKHNAQVKLFVGAAEVMARVRVLGTEAIAPGESGWLQLALEESIALVRGERYILRRPSPAATIGGGRILDPHPGRRHRRFRPEVLTRLKTLAQGTPDDLLLQTLQRQEPTNQAKLLQASQLNQADAQTALTQLLADNRVVALGKQLLSTNLFTQLQSALLKQIDDHHQAYPLRLGMPREEARSRLKLAAAVFNPLVERLVTDEFVVAEEAFLRRPQHAIRFSDGQQAAIDTLLQRFGAAGVNSPSVKEAKAAVGDDVYAALVDLHQLQPINQDVVYTQETYTDIEAQIVARLHSDGAIDAGGVRDMLQTSRKYSIAWLEHLDEKRITRRVGDQRELR